MISDAFTLELRPVLTAQRDLLGRLKAEIDAAAGALAISDRHVGEIEALNQMLADLEGAAGVLLPGDLADFDPNAIPALYESRSSLVRKDLQGMTMDDWPSFVRQSLAYDAERGLDPLLAYDAYLTAADLATLRQESYEQQYRWDKWDYIAVGVAGTLAALTDFLLVRIPKSMTYQGKWDQKGSPLTEWLKRYDTSGNAEHFRTDWFARLARNLEHNAKVPFDGIQGIAGMSGRTHRFQSLGHDPVLGFVVGIFDLLRGTITGFSYDHLTGAHGWSHGAAPGFEPVGIIEAVLKQIGHLLSDVATPAGLPAPFMPLAQSFNLGRFGPKGRSIGELARWMYTNGYDLRHFLVGGLCPALIEIILRAFIMIRHYVRFGDVKFDLASHPKYRSMLLTAHGVAAVANAGKVALYHGNPLAINEAQWLALIRYLLPSMKYWLFDRDRLKWEHLERISEAGWSALEARSGELLERLAEHEFPVIELGREIESDV